MCFHYRVWFWNDKPLKFYSSDAFMVIPLHFSTLCSRTHSFIFSSYPLMHICTRFPLPLCLRPPPPPLSLSLSLSLPLSTFPFSFFPPPTHRIVNLSSGLGRITYISKKLQQEILSPDMTEEKLSAIMEQFVQWVHKHGGYQCISLASSLSSGPSPAFHSLAFQLTALKRLEWVWRRG